WPNLPPRPSSSPLRYRAVAVTPGMAYGEDLSVAFTHRPPSKPVDGQSAHSLMLSVAFDQPFIDELLAARGDGEFDFDQGPGAHPSPAQASPAGRGDGNGFWFNPEFFPVVTARSGGDHAGATGPRG